MTTKYIIQVLDDKDVMYVDDNGWLQPDKGLAKRYTVSADAQSEVASHTTNYGITGTVLSVS